MAEWHTLVELKRQELMRKIDETLRQLNLLLNSPQPNLRETYVKMNNMIGELKREVDTKMKEIKTIEPEKATTLMADDGFFRRNYDYNEGFYSDLER